MMQRMIIAAAVVLLVAACNGDTGPIGPEGPPGQQGEQGIAGPKGDKGDPGDPGQQGDQGIPGTNGTDGQDGATGPEGPTGPTGPAGPKGDKGDTGDTGPQGPEGPTGDGGAIVELWSDFEDANIPQPPWVFAGDDDWSATTLESFYGNRSARSGTIGDNQISSMGLTVDIDQAGLVSFFAAVHSQVNFDWLNWYVDGSRVGRISGGGLTWQAFTFTLPPGEHFVSWVYEKDGSVSIGSDRGWIDGVLITNYNGSPKMTVPESTDELTVEIGPYARSQGMEVETIKSELKSRN